MKIIKTILHKGEWLLDALKRVGCNMIPTNTILNKTLTGLGATWKIQCKLPPKTKRFCPLVLK